MDSKDFLRPIQAGFGSNLSAIFLMGSGLEGAVSCWSDIDLVVVVDKFNIGTQKEAAELSRKMTKALSVPISLDLISQREAVNPIRPLSFLHSKMIQALFEINLFPQKILYQRNCNARFYRPSPEEIRFISLKDIAFFYQEARKITTREYCGQLVENNRLVENTRKVIRLAFNMTKFACQFITLYPEQSREQILIAAGKNFSCFDFKILKNLQTCIALWGSVKNDGKSLADYYEMAVKYIYDFFTFLNSPIDKDFPTLEIAKQ